MDDNNEKKRGKGRPRKSLEHVSEVTKVGELVPGNPVELANMKAAANPNPKLYFGGKRRWNTATVEEREYVRQNMMTMTVEAMATHLNLDLKMVNYIIEKIRIEERRALEDKKNVEIIDSLTCKPFYAQLRRQFSKEEIDFFKYEWVQTIRQFNEDLLPTEENELKDMIILEIMKGQALRKNLELKKRKDVLQVSLTQSQILNQPTTENRILQGELRTEIENCIKMEQDNMRHFKELTEKSAAMRKALSASRQQRVTRIMNARANFSEWIRAIQDNENRSRVAREMELMKMSLQKEEERLGKFVKFADKKMDVPLLNSDTAFDKEFEDNYEDLTVDPPEEPHSVK